MSVDSKLFVTCGKDKTIVVGQAVEKALNAYIRELLDEDVKSRGYLNLSHYASEMKKHSPRFKISNGVEDINVSDFRMYSFYFNLAEHSGRQLRMFVDCSCDYSDTYEGDKIIFSIGCWGKHDEIMKVVAKAVAPFGDVYYDHNDCDDEDFIKLF